MRRRRFFRQLMGDGVAFVEELSGKPQLRLKDLWHYSDERLRAMRPTFVAGATVFALDGRMLGRRGSVEPVDLYALEDDGTFVLSRFDGRSPLGEIALELAAARGWRIARAEGCAKEVFLRLVALGLCAPMNSLTDDTGALPSQSSSQEGSTHE